MEDTYLEPIEDFYKKIFCCKKCFEQYRPKSIYYRTTNVRIGFMFQNPSTYKQEQMNQIQEIEKHGTFEDRMTFHIAQLKNWIFNNSQNKAFFIELFRIFKNKNLIDYDEFNDYIKNENFLDDIYFFDALKCAGTTEEIDNKKYNICSNNFINEELSHFTNLEVLFITSTRAWNMFKKIYNPKLISNVNIKKHTITKVHGYLYSATIHNKKVYVIPLVHPSSRSRMGTLRNSYFDYLEEGIDEINSRKLVD